MSTATPGSAVLVTCRTFLVPPALSHTSLSFTSQEGAGFPLPCFMPEVTPFLQLPIFFLLIFLTAAENKCKRKAETLGILLVACFHF